MTMANEPLADARDMFAAHTSPRCWRCRDHGRTAQSHQSGGCQLTPAARRLAPNPY